MAENENQKGADRADRIIESPKRRGFDMSQLAGDRFPPPAWHFDKIAEEMACPEPKDRMMGVVKRMGSQTVPDFSGIDWGHVPRVVWGHRIPDLLSAALPFGSGWLPIRGRGRRR